MTVVYIDHTWVVTEVDLPGARLGCSLYIRSDWLNARCTYKVILRIIYIIYAGLGLFNAYCGWDIRYLEMLHCLVCQA